jgi:hypothetical protein
VERILADVGAEPPGTPCRHCGKADGAVIRDPFRGVQSKPLHESCAVAWFERPAAPESTPSTPLDYHGPTVEVPDMGPDPLGEHGEPTKE